MVLAITIDNIDEETAEELRIRAATNGCSPEAEAGNMLRFVFLERLEMLPEPKYSGTAIHERVNGLGITDVAVPPRQSGEPIRIIFAADDDADDC